MKLRRVGGGKGKQSGEGKGMGRVWGDEEGDARKGQWRGRDIVGKGIVGTEYSCLNKEEVQ